MIRRPGEELWGGVREGARKRVLEVILRGDGDFAAWQRELNRRYLPHVVVLAIPSDQPDLPAALAKPAGTAVNAWVCRGVTCLPPVTGRADLLSLLAAPAVSAG